MKSLNKEALMWLVNIAGTILFSMTVYNLGLISKNLDKINTNIEGLNRLTDKLDLRLRYIEIQVDKQELELKELQKEINKK